MSRGKYWCFTLNNYTQEEEKFISEAVTRNEDITYICYGREIGQLGTPHLQGYVEFKQRIRIGSLKRIDGFGRMHLERRGGTALEAKSYCEKENDFHEFGNLSKSSQGKRTDLDDIRKWIDDGKSDLDIANEYFGSWCRYRKSFNAYRMLSTAKDARDVKVYSISGAPGVGKTRCIFENESDLWICPDPTLKWFDGYQGEPAVLIDDFDGNAEPRFLLRLLDRYPMAVPVKGGYVAWIPKRIYITSNTNCPFGMFAIEEPLKRRITADIEVTKALYVEQTDREEDMPDEPTSSRIPYDPTYASSSTIRCRTLEELKNLLNFD